MPFDPSLGQSSNGGNAVGSILGGLPIVGGVLNGVSQIFTNARNRRFQREMYDKQRNDALADWSKQNEYNSPSAQMERLKSGGLNPNLVYGNGAVAMSSQPPRGSSPAGATGTAPQFNLGGTLPALMFDLNKQLAEMKLENLKTQNLVLQQQVPNIAARTDLTNTQNASQQFDLSMKMLLKDVTLARSEADLNRVLTGTQVLLDSNERAALTNAQSLQLGVQRILQLRLDNAMNPLKREYLRSMIDAVGKSNELRDLEISLKQKGFSWSDPYWIRVGSTIVDNIQNKLGNPDLKEAGSGFYEAFKSLLHLR